jgi:hypothetical protein
MRSGRGKLWSSDRWALLAQTVASSAMFSYVFGRYNAVDLWVFSRR